MKFYEYDSLNVEKARISSGVRRFLLRGLAVGMLITSGCARTYRFDKDLQPEAGQSWRIEDVIALLQTQYQGAKVEADTGLTNSVSIVIEKGDPAAMLHGVNALLAQKGLGYIRVFVRVDDGGEDGGDSYHGHTDNIQERFKTAEEKGRQKARQE